MRVLQYRYFLRSDVAGTDKSLTWAAIPTLPSNVPSFYSAISGATSGQFLKVATESGANVVKYETVTIPAGNQLVPTITTNGYFLRSDDDGINQTLTWAEIDIPSVPANVPAFHSAISGASSGQFLKVGTESGANVVKYESVTIPDVSEFITADSTDILTNKSISYSQLTGTPTIPFVPENVPLFHSSIQGATDGQFLKVATESGNKGVKYESVTIPSGNQLVPTITNDGYFLRSDDDGIIQTLTWVEAPTPPLASPFSRGGVKIGYTQNAKNYPLQLSAEKAFVNVPWTDTTYTLPTATTSTLGGIIIGTGLSMSSSVCSVDLSQYTVSNSIKLDTTGNSCSITTGDAGLRGIGRMLIITDYTTDTASTDYAAASLLIVPNSGSGRDSRLAIRGHRNAATDQNQAQLMFENFDDNIGTSVQSQQIGRLGLISGRVTNATTNVGGLYFYSSSNGIALTECFNISSTNTLSVGGNLAISASSTISGIEIKEEDLATSTDPFYLSTSTNINVASVTFNWNDTNNTGSTTYSAGITHTNGQPSFTVNITGTYVISVGIFCFLGASNNRSNYYLKLNRRTSAGVFKNRYFISGSNYYRDDNDNFDDVALTGTITIGLTAGETFEIVCTALYRENTGAVTASTGSSISIERLSTTVVGGGN
jgi:hypothetical protein